MTPVEFLTKNTYSFQPAQYNEAMADANNMDTKEWVSKWGPVFEAHENLAVDWNNSDLSKFNKDKWTRMRETFGSDDQKNPFNKPEADLKAKWQKDFKDMTFGDFKKDVGTMSKHWETEKKAREYNTGRYHRQQEVKKGGPKWWLASEYSKNRYINEPEKSVFSDEGEWYNKGDDVRDVMLGGAGLIGDFIPGMGAVVGPVARGVRDVVNYDDKYGKSLEDIAKERGLDLGAFGGAAWLANFRKGKRMAAGASKDIPFVGDALENAAFSEGIKDTNKGLGIITLTKDLNTAKKAIDAMPDNSIKGRLLKEFGDFHQYGNAEAEGAFMERLKAIANAEITDLNMYTVTKEGRNFKPVNTEELGVNVPGLYTSPQRAVGEKAAIKNADIKQAARFTPEVGPVGAFIRDVALPVERKVEQGAAKRLSTQYEADINDKDRVLKDWYKKNYSRDWDMGFKPNEKDGDPLWEAYKEYKGL